MKIKELNFVEYEGQPNEWELGNCTLGEINLFVGRNATGKTRILNILNGLARQLSRSEKVLYTSASYEICFDKDGKEIRYILELQDRKVEKEQFISDGDLLLDRKSDGTGGIYAAEVKGLMRLHIPPDEVAARTKRDMFQHKFLEDLFYWADSLFHFSFGSTLGRTRLVTFSNQGEVEAEIDAKDTEQQVVAIFKKALETFGEEFKTSVIDDMAAIGYEIEDIYITKPTGVSFPPFASQAVGLAVKEAGLTAQIDQIKISQGMFRALSLIIQMKSAIMGGNLSCVLIDDIGEGLDFDRSTRLIKLLIDRARKHSIQMMMSTNDRFVMNSVPLEYWTIVHRIGSKVRCININNRPELFEEFELTGLNNFDFFSSNFLTGDLESNA